MALIAALPPDHREVIREKYVLAVDIGQSSDPTAVAAIHPQGRAGVATLAGSTEAPIMADTPDRGSVLSRANRASPTSRNRRFGSFSRHCASS